MRKKNIMIIYGTRSVLIKHQNAINEKCTHCQVEKSINLGVYQKYAHVFWIAFFPMTKIYASQCSHCKQVLTNGQIPVNIQQKYFYEDKTIKTPWWTFSGVAILGLIIVSSLITSVVRTSLNKREIKNPEVGDIYTIYSGDGNYTLFKVNKVTQDSVFANPLKYQGNLSSINRKFDDVKDTSFSDEVYATSKVDLVKQYVTGKISEIRKK